MPLGRTVEEETQILASYLPGGLLFGAKNIPGTELRGLLEGLAGEDKRIDDTLDLMREQLMPDTTTMFVDEWESAVGIPDSCFKGTGTIAERRAIVLLKLAGLGVQTASDFEELALGIGFTVSVEPGNSVANRPLFGSDKEARFTIVVKHSTPTTGGDVFPLPFPFTFGTPGADALLTCLFNKLKPANCNVLFVAV